MKKKLLVLSLLFLFIFLSIFGCDNSSSNINSLIKNDSTSKQNYNLVYTKYKIPLPVELFKFLEKNSKFNLQYLNDIKNTENYLTEVEKATNLGIYTTDLIYCNVFVQSELSLIYFDNTKSISNSINIQVGYTKDFIKRLETNCNNKDSLISIVDESYWKACNHLDKNGQNNILPFVVFGNWIEGLYIITQSKETVPETRIKEHILSKKQGLENIINYLFDVQIESSAFYYNNDLKAIIKHLEVLLKLFEKQELKPTDKQIYYTIEKEIIKIRNSAVNGN